MDEHYCKPGLSEASRPLLFLSEGEVRALHFMAAGEATELRLKLNDRDVSPQIVLLLDLIS